MTVLLLFSRNCLEAVKLLDPKRLELYILTMVVNNYIDNTSDDVNVNYEHEVIQGFTPWHWDESWQRRTMLPTFPGELFNFSFKFSRGRPTPRIAFSICRS